MSTGLFPHRPPVEQPERDTRVAALGTGEAAAVCKLLGTETATAILARLGESPATASDLASGMDTSLQNVDYHLKRLEEAGLVRDVGTWLSERGSEMTVYASTLDRLVIETDGTDGERDRAGTDDTVPDGTATEETVTDEADGDEAATDETTTVGGPALGDD